MSAAMVLVLLFFLQVMWSIWDDYRNTIETEYEHLSIRVRLTEAQLSGSFRSVDLLLRALSERRIKNINAPVESFRRELKNSLGLIPEISALFATNARGIAYGHTEPALDGFDSTRREYFKSHAESAVGDSGLLVSKPFKGAAGRQVFTVSRAMRGPAGEFMGVIVARLEMNTFAEVFRPITHHKTAALTLFYTDGDVLFRWPDPDHYVGRNFRNGPAFVDHIASGATETRHRNVSAVDGVERIAVFRRLKVDNLTLVVSRDVNEVIARWRLSSLQRLGALALIIAITALAFFLIQRRQREIERTQRFSERILNNANVMVIGFDREGRVALCNEAAEQISGYSRAELLATRWFELLVPRERFPRVWQDLLGAQKRNEIPVNMETPILTKNGTEHQIDWRNTVLDDAGSSVVMVSFGMDITERRHAEMEIYRLNESLEQRVRDRTAELEVSNRELESFSYSVAHDLRAPLRGINGFSTILANDYAGKLDAQGQGYLQRIRAATIRMGNVMDDLLALARAGKAELQRQEIDLSAMAQKVAASLASADPQRRRVEFVIAAGLTANADPGLMRIALDNLFANAWKFSAKTEGARIEFGLTAAAGKPAYFVRDNGAGFDPALSSKLFEQFQRLHTNEEFEGTGLGLAIVARVIRRHGGRVWAEGAVGRGAAFYFTLS